MLMERLIEKIIEKKSPIVVGLDPRLENLPQELVLSSFEKHGESLKAVSEAIVAFNKTIIDAVHDLVPAVKPQIAFYEQYGLEGMRAYLESCEYAKAKGLIVIGDIKRGDIGTTSKAYSIAHLGTVHVGAHTFKAFDTDIITVNPYLGDDCLKEFMDEVKVEDKGLFVLVKTSNKSSGQIQDLAVDGEKVYEKVANMVANWNEKTLGPSGYSPIGAVVGATYPAEMDLLRLKMPHAFFLVPGYGAQGGTAKDIVGAFNQDGLGAVINSSRGIIYAFENSNLSYAEAARNATLTMRDDINEALENVGKVYWR